MRPQFSYDSSVAASVLNITQKIFYFVYKIYFYEDFTLRHVLYSFELGHKNIYLCIFSGILIRFFSCSKAYIFLKL